LKFYQVPHLKIFSDLYGRLNEIWYDLNFSIVSDFAF
jgi:hypothetical protein